MLKHVVFGSSLAAGAAGVVGFWKVCVCVCVLPREGENKVVTAFSYPGSASGQRRQAAQ